MELGENMDRSYHGLRAVVLENNVLRVVVLPEAGARIWQITYKPAGAAPIRWAVGDSDCYADSNPDKTQVISGTFISDKVLSLEGS
jgi:hypothetical protein